MQADIAAITERVRCEGAFVQKLLGSVGRVIVGQTSMVERILIGILCDGHVLLEGVPGLAKTTAVRAVADSLALAFARIQFTPDLLPADLVGTMIYDPSRQKFEAKKGPLFANLILADEINRAPAKVQSALLEAMQERQVTLGDGSHALPMPFFVLATQNPIEQEGTYPLPEAQVDRFMLLVKVQYPTRAEEREILDRVSAGMPKLEPVIRPEELLRAQEVVRSVYVDEKIKDYVLDLVGATRAPEKAGVKGLSSLIEYGASPRASIFLVQAARAHAFLRGRGYVTPEDIKAIGFDVLRHRLLRTYEAEAEEVTSDDIVQRLFDSIAVP